MGIVNVNVILDEISNATTQARGKTIFNAHPRLYNIIIDGEIMRYKGFLDNVMHNAGAEHVIATISTDCTVKIVNEIEQLLTKGTRNEVLIYMDGKRVSHKFHRPTMNHDVDMALIRTLYTDRCINQGYRVIALKEGEAELNMYTRRFTDRGVLFDTDGLPLDGTKVPVDLNVFITGDSDFLSICYGHLPMNSNCTNLEKFDRTALIMAGYPIEYSKASYEMDHTNKNRSLFSNSYNDDITLRDSALWVRTRNGALTNQMYGMDGISDVFGFTIPAFRIFIAMCGTDFTKPILTKTMIQSIMNSHKSDRDLINDLTRTYNPFMMENEIQYSKIYAAFLFMGIKYRQATIKKLSDITARQPFECNTPADTANALNEFVSTYLRMYLTYIATCKVLPAPRFPDMGHVLRYYLYAMRGGLSEPCIGKLNITAGIKKWAENITLEKALENFTQHFGEFPITDLGQPKTKEPKVVIKKPQINRKRTATRIDNPPPIKSNKLSSEEDPLNTQEIRLKYPFLLETDEIIDDNYIMDEEILKEFMVDFSEMKDAPYIDDRSLIEQSPMSESVFQRDNAYKIINALKK